MKRYIPITLESESSIIGVNNGIFQCEIKPKKFKYLSGFTILSDFYNGYEFDSDHNRNIDSSIEIEYCQLLKKAYLTNFLSFSPYLLGCHFIVDEKTYNVLSSFNLGRFSRFFPLNLYDSKGQLVREKYFLFFQDLLLNSWIDFKNSIFYTGHSITGDRKSISFNNSKEYNEVLFKNTEQIVLNEKFDLELDFFSPRIDTRFFVSEDLWGEIERNRLIGLRRTQQINDITVANNI